MSAISDYQNVAPCDLVLFCALTDLPPFLLSFVYLSGNCTRLNWKKLEFFWLSSARLFT